VKQREQSLLYASHDGLRLDATTAGWSEARVTASEDECYFVPQGRATRADPLNSLSTWMAKHVEVRNDGLKDRGSIHLAYK
jgi:hypothetical protein